VIDNPDRTVCAAFALIAIAAAAAGAAPAGIVVRDVSPEARSQTGDGRSPAGKMMAIVADPVDPRNVYAASQWAGVWRSTDAGRSWAQASRFLATGSTSSRARHALAIDDLNPARLVYLTPDDDMRPDTPPPGPPPNPAHRGRGLWISTSRADSWVHVPLAGCPGPGLVDAAFRGGTAWIASQGCRAILSSTDLQTWRTVRLPSKAPNEPLVAIAVSNSSVYACSSSWLARWKIGGDAANPVWDPGSVNGTCQALAAVPGDPDSVLILRSTTVKRNGETLPVWTVDRYHYGSPAGVTTSLGQVSIGGGSGQPVLEAHARLGAGNGPGRSYDVVASNMLQFFVYDPTAAGNWRMIPNNHVDTWGFAFGDACTALSATDGGIFRATDAHRPCRLDAGDPWVLSSQGLHAFGSTGVVGIGHACPSGSGSCPALYVASGDNDTWVRMPDGVWRTTGYSLGDSGNVLFDHGLSKPKLVVATRGGTVRVFGNRDGEPPLDDWGDHSPASAYFELAGPPQEPGLTQIQTIRNEPSAPCGDYLAALRGSQPGFDTVVRNTRAGCAGDHQARPTDWVRLAPGVPLGFARVGAVAAGGGHRAPTVYLLSALMDRECRPLPDGGDLYKATVDPTTGALAAPFQKLPRRSDRGAPNYALARNLFVDPYNPDHVYITDGNTGGSIRSSADGGASWKQEIELEEVASRGGEFRLECGFPNCDDDDVFGRTCPLSQVVFVRDRPSWRFAILHPGGVAFSRDGGAHWIPLPEVTSVIDRPFAGWFDDSRFAALFVSLRGHGVIQIQAPFATLARVTFRVTGARTPALSTVFAVDETSGRSTRLELSPAGFRGSEVIDAAGGALSYHYEVRTGVEPVQILASARFTHTITVGERASGAVELQDRWQ
jgi:hypothetical protein